MRAGRSRSGWRPGGCPRGRSSCGLPSRRRGRGGWGQRPGAIQPMFTPPQERCVLRAFETKAPPDVTSHYPRLPDASCCTLVLRSSRGGPARHFRGVPISHFSVSDASIHRHQRSSGSLQRDVLGWPELSGKAVRPSDGLLWPPVGIAGLGPPAGPHGVAVPPSPGHPEPKTQPWSLWTSPDVHHHLLRRA
jgi:hypothetical protein